MSLVTNINVNLSVLMDVHLGKCRLSITGQDRPQVSLRRRSVLKNRSDVIVDVQKVRSNVMFRNNS